MKKNYFLARAAMTLLLTIVCLDIQAQETTTFKYTATEKISRFENESFKALFVGATAIVSHDFDAGTGNGTVVYEGTVTALGNNALMFQSALTSIVIPEGVTKLGFQAFKGCSNITTIKLPKSLNTTEGLVFDGCSGLANGKLIVDDLAWWCSVSWGGPYSTPLYYAKHIYSDEDTEITNLIIPEGVTSIGSDAFNRCEGITSVSFPSTLKSIGDNAFANTGLKSVDITKGLTTINSGAFMNCANLTSVTIPEGVETIGGSAFCKTGLTSLKLPSTIRSMSQSFYGCESLATLTLTDGITTLGGSFYSCTALTSVNIPGSIKEVGSSDFSSCTGLTTVTLNEGTEKVDFNDCTNLETINFPTSIKKVAIKGSSKLETVTLNEGIQEIISFNDCSALQQINVPSTVIYVGTFKNCNALEKVIVADVASWCAARHYDSRYYGPQKQAGKLYLGTVDQNEEITNLVVPEGVTKITGEAFLGLPNITTVTLPSTLTTMENKVFQGCTGVTDVYSLANPVTMSWSESDNNFKDGKETLMHVLDVEMWKSKFPNANATFVSDMMQVNYTATSAVNFSKKQFTGATAMLGNFFDTETGNGYAIFSGNVTAVAKQAFAGATTLTSIDLPDGIATIGSNAFNGCTGLTTMTLPSTVTLFKDNAFAGLENITDVWCVADPTALTWNGTGFKPNKETLMHVPLAEDWEEVFQRVNVTLVSDMTRFRYTAMAKESSAFNILEKFTGAEEIVSHVFNGETGEGTLIFKGIVTKFNDPFKNNKNLTGITVPSSVTEIGGQAFYECSNLKTVILPDAITSLGDYIFNRCTSLTTVNIPNMLTNLPMCMFTKCTSLTDITIPEGVESIGSYAFSDCTGLTNLAIPLTVNTVYSHAFDGCTNITDVFCKAEPFTKWDGNNSGFKPERATKFFVSDADAWMEKFPNANVTFFTFILGDVDGKDGLTAADVVGMVRIIAGDTEGLYPDRADMNGDGEVNIADVVAIAKLILSE
ncbi:MAG: leucine-rich repeat protein [Prevotella sp.]|nr:leucine-rich repeat protein [Prevotella sp.]